MASQTKTALRRPQSDVGTDQLVALLPRDPSTAASAAQACRQVDGAANERLDIRVLGLASIASDVSPELALTMIESVVVLGAFHAPAAVKAALAGRIR